MDAYPSGSSPQVKPSPRSPDASAASPVPLPPGTPVRGSSGPSAGSPETRTPSGNAVAPGNPEVLQTPPSAAAGYSGFPFGFTADGLPPVRTVALPGKPDAGELGDEVLDQFVKTLKTQPQVMFAFDPTVDYTKVSVPPSTVFPGLPAGTRRAEAEAVDAAKAAAGAPAAPAGGKRSTYRRHRPLSVPKPPSQSSFSQHRPNTRRRLV